MLPGAGLGDDPALPQALGQHHLPDRVVDLVSTGVCQVFTLQKHAIPRLR
jgi:hypothetical protein